MLHRSGERVPAVSHDARFLIIPPIFLSRCEKSEPPLEILGGFARHAYNRDMNSPLRLAVPKGRLFDELLSILAGMGHDFPGIQSTRSLSIPSADGALEILVLRNVDIPTYVVHGAAEFGLVGKDVLLEFDDREGVLLELLDLGFGRCRLAMASLGGVVPDVPVWRVATKYPQVTERIFQERGKPVEIVKLNGAVELAPLTGIADVILDLVETGKTLEANGLKIIEEVYVSTARLVANRVLYKIRGGAARDLVIRIEQAVKSRALQSQAAGPGA